jgi:hypothetical protein
MLSMTGNIFYEKTCGIGRRLIGALGDWNMVDFFSGYWVPVLLIMVVTGAFGGVLGVFSLFNIPDLLSGKPTVKTKTALVMATLVGATGGIGGAIAILALFAADSKFPEDGKVSQRLKLGLCAAGVTAGFIGYRVLGTMSAALEEKLRRLARDTEEKLLQSVEAGNRQTQLITEAINALQPNAPEFAARAAIERCSSFLKDVPDAIANRDFLIPFARLHRKVKQLPEALQLLTQYLRHRTAAAAGVEPADKDVADVRYNRACYYSVMADAEPDPNKRKQLQQQAIDDLKRSVEISPTNLADAKTDDDFKSLHGDPRFRKLG